MKKTLIAFLFAALLSVPLSAQSQKGGKRTFEKLDTNGDSFVTLAEYVAGVKKPESKEKMTAAFGRRDKDGDGKLSKKEMAPGKGKGKAKGEGKPKKDKREKKN